MVEILTQARAWLAEGRPIALACVVSTWGSSPFPVGSLMVIADDGNFAGAVSGGCVEAAVIAEAPAVIASGRPKLLTFGVSNETAWEVGLVCGGRMLVALFAVTGEAMIAALEAAHVAGQATALVVELASGAHGVLSLEGVAVEAGLSAAAIDLGRRGLAGAAGRATGEDSDGVIVVTFPGRWRIIAVGAVTITQALATLTEMLNYALVIVEPRAGFAEQQPAFQVPAIAPAQVLIAWPEEAFARLALDRQTAVVTLSHDPKIDDEALVAALGAGVFYIGALGSRRTHQRRLQRLRQRGFKDADLARIHGPVGLAIGGRSAAEIALSIMAEITQVRHALPVPDELAVRDTPHQRQRAP
ncbi:MAG: XdhC family protein [Rhodospirillales bacterium]|nr:XdhC family protein [Rhodospirillales bacterium]